MLGQTISHYKILTKLGGGGMGVVYKAQDLKLNRPIALEFLPPNLTHDEEAKQRFVHEAQAASALDHNNICTIYEIDETEDDQIFICMAYYEGETLQKKVNSAGAGLSVRSVIEIAIQIAQGLAKAHEHGIMHRDIKPANVMITKDRVVKILDFGLAKLAGLTRLTKSGMTVGTAAYMSPEQARGEEADHHTDIWSLGVVLYGILSASPPKLRMILRPVGRAIGVGFILPPIAAGTMRFGKSRHQEVMPFGLQLTPMEFGLSSLLTASGFITRNKRNPAFGEHPFKVGKNHLSWNFRSPNSGCHGA